MDQQRQSEILKFDQKYAKGIRHRFSRIGFSLAIMVLFAQLGALLAHALLTKYAYEITQTSWYSWTLSSVFVYFIGVPLFFLCAGKDKTAAVPQQNKMKAKDFLVMLLIAIAVMYAGNYVGSYLMAFVSSLRGQMIENPIQVAVLNSNMWVNVVATVILAPVLEELVFRKLMIDRLGGFGEKTVMVFSALMFALYHCNFYQFFYAFGLGLLMAYVYLRTGKVWYTILLHMIINFFGSILSALLLRNLDQELLYEFLEIASDTQRVQAMMEDTEAYAAFIERFLPALPGFFAYSAYSTAFLGLAIAGGILFLARMRKFVFRQAPFELPRERVGYTIYFSPGVIVAIFSTLALSLILILA